MIEVRAKPGDLCMADAMPFQQHYEYRTTWPIADILTPKLFLNQRSQLYAGDSITICRYDRLVDRRNRESRLLEIATVRVVASSQEGVEMHLVGKVELLAGAEEPVPAGASDRIVRHQGRGRYAVLAQDGTEITGGLSKDEAEAIARGDLPVPQAA